jgi:hypothetical protein
VTKSRLAQLFSILRTSLPTQRDSRLRVDERRCRRVLLLAAACSSTGSHRFDMASVSCLLLRQRRRKQWRPNAGDRGGRARARVRTAQGNGEPPLVAEGDGDRPWRAGCKSAYLHVRRHLYCLVTTRATTPVLPCQDTCSDTCILIFWASRPGAS